MARIQSHPTRPPPDWRALCARADELRAEARAIVAATHDASRETQELLALCEQSRAAATDPPASDRAR